MAAGKDRSRAAARHGGALSPVMAVFNVDLFRGVGELGRSLGLGLGVQHGAPVARGGGGAVVRFCGGNGKVAQVVELNSRGRRGASKRRFGAVVMASLEGALAEREGMPSVDQLLKRPIALLGLVPQGPALLAAGAVAGALAKTVSCPLDRTKILLQVGGKAAGLDPHLAATAQSGSVVKTFLAIGKSEGIKGYFRGNIPQVIRAVPYDAVRLAAYEAFKDMLRDKETGELSVPARLVAGAAAGMTSTLVTYPLDTIRFRLAVDPTLHTIPQVVRRMMKEEGLLALYKGLLPSLAGIAPYIAINYTSFDLLKKSLPENLQNDGMGSFATAFVATTIATTCCYPLDTLRRQMQMKEVAYANVFDAFVKMSAANGPLAVYRGFIPNMLKNLPTNSVRLTAFDVSKVMITDGHAAYDELLEEMAGKKSPRKCASC